MRRKNTARLRWILPEDTRVALPPDLLEKYKLSPLAASILSRNGLCDCENIERFLSPKLRTLSDPFLLPEMSRAVARIDQALRQREKILLYGDYDVDGVTSLTILARLLLAYGGDVEMFLPSRSEEGYGLSDLGIERCLQNTKNALLIAVDCGTNSVEEVKKIRQYDADVIIVDHHEYSGVRPDCIALVNPKCGEDFQYLCSAGLAFKLAHALLKNCPLPGFDLKNYLDLVALATLADLVPLIEENRILVRYGLLQLEKSCWPGVAALMRVSGVGPRVSSEDVGFRLGPRINAAGRVGSAYLALQLLMTNDVQEADKIARQLHDQNTERQSIERQVTEEADAWVKDNFNPENDYSIVMGNEQWHEGVLGIVASRVMRLHHRPSLIVSFQNDGSGKGSGRSIEGLSLVEALQHCSDLLEGYGGHEMAAGLTIRRENFEAFQKRFEDVVKKLLDQEMLIPSIQLDAEMPIDCVDFDTLDEQASLEPYGMGNRQPLLFTRALTPSEPPRVLKDKHLRIAFSCNGSKRIQSIYFNGAQHELPRPPWDVAFRLERNEWNGRVEAQMNIVAIRASEA
ncbi:MAG: single-stranded-DNA-specific exonuclease RecJ [Chthoniobacterales bacterium]